MRDLLYSKLLESTKQKVDINLDALSTKKYAERFLNIPVVVMFSKKDKFVKKNELIQIFKKMKSNFKTMVDCEVPHDEPRPKHVIQKVLKKLGDLRIKKKNMQREKYLKLKTSTEGNHKKKSHLKRVNPLEIFIKQTNKKKFNKLKPIKIQNKNAFQSRQTLKKEVLTQNNNYQINRSLNNSKNICINKNHLDVPRNNLNQPNRIENANKIYKSPNKNKLETLVMNTSINELAENNLESKIDQINLSYQSNISINNFKNPISESTFFQNDSLLGTRKFKVNNRMLSKDHDSKKMISISSSAKRPKLGEFEHFNQNTSFQDNNIYNHPKRTSLLKSILSSNANRISKKVPKSMVSFENKQSFVGKNTNFKSYLNVSDFGINKIGNQVREDTHLRSTHEPTKKVQNRFCRNTLNKNIGFLKSTENNLTKKKLKKFVYKYKDNNRPFIEKDDKNLYLNNSFYIKHNLPPSNPHNKSLNTSTFIKNKQIRSHKKNYSVSHEQLDELTNKPPRIYQVKKKYFDKQTLVRKVNGKLATSFVSSNPKSSGEFSKQNLRNKPEFVQQSISIIKDTTHAESVSIPKKERLFKKLPNTKLKFYLETQQPESGKKKHYRNVSSNLTELYSGVRKTFFPDAPQTQKGGANNVQVRRSRYTINRPPSKTTSDQVYLDLNGINQISQNLVNFKNSTKRG
jgi:hypothetical protein